jgi:hypothetical protein
VDLVIAIGFLLLLIPAAIVGGIAYLTMDQSTRRGAIKRLYVLSLLAVGFVTFGYFSTREGSPTPDGCAPEECMIDVDGFFDGATWIAVGAAAFVLILFALQTVWTLVEDDFEDSPSRQPPGPGANHPPGGMQDSGKTD